MNDKLPTPIMNREIKKLNKNILKSLNNYRKTITYLTADAPIGILCLPTVIENILIRADCLRVYDLLNRDLAKIKGLSDRRLALLTSRLNEFIAMG